MTFAVRAPHEHELEAFVSCINTGFGIHPSPAERERFVRGLIGADLFAAFDGSELVGTLSSYTVEHTLPGPVVSSAGAVTDVTVLPTHRRRGALTQLMMQSLEALQEKGESLALLHASEGAIYRRFGFGAATFSARYRIERHTSGLQGNLAGTTGSVRMLSAGEAHASFPAVYDDARRTQVGEIARLEAWWDELFAIAEQPGQPARFFACHEHDGVIDGYLIYELRGEFHLEADRECFIVELCSCSPEAYRALIGFALGIDLTGRLVTDERPVDETLQFMLEDPRALRVLGVRDRTWARILDLEAALRARRYRGAGSIVFEVHDALFASNSRTIAVEVESDGQASVQSSTGKADITCDIASLSAAYLGAMSFSRLADAGVVTARGKESLRRANLLFGEDRAPFCTAMF